MLALPFEMIYLTKPKSAADPLSKLVEKFKNKNKTMSAKKQGCSYFLSICFRFFLICMSFFAPDRVRYIGDHNCVILGISDR